MKKILPFLAAIALFSSAQVFAQTATPPSKESLTKLLELLDTQAMIPQIQAELDGIMTSISQAAVKDKTVTPEQQKALDAFRSKVVKIGKDEISWAVMEPRMAEIYGNALTQEDVDGMIVFYQSPAGQSFVKKMPEIMKQTTIMMQKISGPMMKKIEAAGNELQQDLQNTVKK